MTSTVRAAIRIRCQYGQRRLPPCDPVFRARQAVDRFADGRKIERAPRRADDLGGALLLEIEADAVGRLADLATAPSRRASIRLAESKLLSAL
jgi:hypothetical protein